MANYADTSIYIRIPNEKIFNDIYEEINEYFDIDYIYPEIWEEDEDFSHLFEIQFTSKYGLPIIWCKAFIKKYPFVSWNMTSVEPGNSYRGIAEYLPHAGDFIESESMFYYETNI